MTALYSGISAALARQASYTTLRLGLYDLMKSVVFDGAPEAVSPAIAVTLSTTIATYCYLQQSSVQNRLL